MFISEADGIQVVHRHDLEVVDSHRIKWANRIEDEVDRNSFVAVVEPAHLVFRIPAISMPIGTGHRCTAIRIWASETNKPINRMHRSIRFGYNKLHIFDIYNKSMIHKIT